MSDVLPSDKIETSEAFKTVRDCRNSINGALSKMQDEEYYGANYLTYGDVKAMDIRTVKAGKRTESMYRYSETTESSTTSLWSHPYIVLNNVNMLIENVNKIEIDDKATISNDNVKYSEEEYLKVIMANAYALRALCHFDLLKIYSRIPTGQRGDAYDKLGVILADKVFDKKSNPKRSTVEEVYTLIYNDIAEANKLMLAKANFGGWFNADGIKALKARVDLYKGNYKAAYDAAKELIDGGNFPLNEKSDFIGSWKGVNQEDIFYIINTTDDNPSREGIGYLYHKDGYNAMYVTDEYRSLFEDNDIRKSLFTDGGVFKKYPDILVNNIHVLRVAEMYLIAAECAVHSAEVPVSDGRDILNQLIEKRTGVANKIANDADLTLDRVLLERRKELAGEGHTFFDFIRNKKDIVRTGDDHLASVSQVMHVKWNDFRTIQPIPRAELNANKLEQNPEYAK
jgi:hypothetical protein